MIITWIVVSVVATELVFAAVPKTTGVARSALQASEWPVLNGPSDLTVELTKPNPEAIQFSTVKQGKQKVHLITYYLGQKKLRSRVVPEAMYLEMKRTFPSPLKKTNVVAPCLVDLAVKLGSSLTEPQCSAKWSRATKSAFAKWYTTTRNLLFD